MQDVQEEARLAADDAAELRNQVHRHESGQPSAASGKTPEHVNIPRLKKQAARATAKAENKQSKASDESTSIGSHLESASVRNSSHHIDMLSRTCLA